MIPIAFADKGQEVIISKVGGNQEIRQHLLDLGLCPGKTCVVISENNGNLIIKLNETRLAISEEMARKIMI